MGRIGSKEIYLTWAKFGITVMSSGLIDITGSRTGAILAARELDGPNNM